MEQAGEEKEEENAESKLVPAIRCGPLRPDNPTGRAGRQSADSPDSGEGKGWETELQGEGGGERGKNHATAPREDGYGQVGPVHHERLPPLHHKSRGGGRSKASKIRGFVLWNMPSMC